MQSKALLLLAGFACTTTREVHKPLNAADLHQLNDAMREKDVDVSFFAEIGFGVDAVHVDATQVHLAPDKARFLVNGAPREVPALALHSLTYLEPGNARLAGAAEGLLFGLPVTAAGAAVGLSAALTCGPRNSCTTETVYPLVVGAALGLVLAPVIGALVGHHDEINFR